jgi:hypothetical protein
MNPINLLLVVLPIAHCLNLKIEDASNLHFCHISDVAGTVGMAHVLMTVNITQHLTLMKQLCTIPPHVHRVDNLLLEQSNLIEMLESHCCTLLGALIERESVWFNQFNLQRNIMTKSTVNNKECTNPHLLSIQSSAFRLKRQAVVGAFLVLGLVAAASFFFKSLYFIIYSCTLYKNVMYNCCLKFGT